MSDHGGPVVLDPAALADLREVVGGDQEFLAEMIDTFLDDGPKRLAEMDTAAGAGDAAGLRRAVHTLKSNCRTFDASALVDRCQRLEELAAVGELEDDDANVLGDVLGDVASGSRDARPHVLGSDTQERSGF